MEPTKHETNTEPQSSKGGVISLSTWSIEEIRELFDFLEPIIYEYGRYVSVAKHLNSIFGNNRTPSACRSMHRRSIIRP